MKENWMQLKGWGKSSTVFGAVDKKALAQTTTRLITEGVSRRSGASKDNLSGHVDLNEAIYLCVFAKFKVGKLLQIWGLRELGLWRARISVGYNPLKFPLQSSHFFRGTDPSRVETTLRDLWVSPGGW